NGGEDDQSPTCPPEGIPEIPDALHRDRLVEPPVSIDEEQASVFWKSRGEKETADEGAIRILGRRISERQSLGEWELGTGLGAGLIPWGSLEAIDGVPLTAGVVLEDLGQELDRRPRVRRRHRQERGVDRAGLGHGLGEGELGHRRLSPCLSWM